MRVHILGICGTFMAGIAVLAKALGHEVTGSDQKVYPPMSTQLEAQGITLHSGYDPAHLNPRPDCVIVGNVMSRGNPELEAVLEQGLRYYSGPQWLSENVLHDRWVLAVAGTHGKTTTSSLLAWILEAAGLNPGFLIGGVAENFGISARLGGSEFFVIEADEYDSAFHDKRSKFLHYHPRTLIINNLEFDHQDIFPDLAAIQRQFHHLIRIVPPQGLILYPCLTDTIDAVLAQGCWTPTATFGLDDDLKAHPTVLGKLRQADGQLFEVFYQGQSQGTVSWPLLGVHNVKNAIAAVAAAFHAGVSIPQALQCLSDFRSVKRRMERRGQINGITIYDDFAHHPTAIATTLSGLRAHVGQEKIIAVLEFASHTMRSGIHREAVIEALQTADHIILKKPVADWALEPLIRKSQTPITVCDDVDTIVKTVFEHAGAQDHVLVMSNSGFDGIFERMVFDPPSP